MDEPNVLFLDEPTNDLDIETLTQLEDLLDGWPGSMIVISHDRFFVERTTDRVFALLGDGTLRMLPRGIDEYLERRKRMEEAAAAASAPAAAATRDAAPERSAADQRAAKKELQRIERQLDKISARRPPSTPPSPRTPRTSRRWPNWTPNCGTWPVSATNWSCAGWNSPRTPDRRVSARRAPACGERTPREEGRGGT